MNHNTIKVKTDPARIDEGIAKLQILHVEDSIDDQVILRRSLQKRLKIDFDLVIVETGKDCLKTLEEDKINLLILDNQLPLMTGIEILKEIRNRQISTPVIFVTGSGNEKIAVEAMKLGCRDYIPKDEINSGRLEEAIRKILFESALPEEVNPKIAKLIISLFLSSPIIQIGILKVLISKPNIQISVSDLISTLEKLDKLGFLKAEPLCSVTACPSCGSLTSTILLKCPECRSLQLIKGDALEHLDCGCIDFRFKFENKERELVCPKCMKRMEQIGVDYRRVGSWYKCSNKHFFGQLILAFKCIECNEEFTLDKAILKMLNQYRLTEKGHQQLQLGMVKNVL